MTIRRLTRSRTEGKVAGVCAGIANYFDVDVVLVRAAWVVFSIVPGAVIGGVLAIASYAVLGNWRWLLAALLMLANCPYTLVVIKPINDALHGMQASTAGGDARRLIETWGTLHAGRSALGAAARLRLGACLEQFRVDVCHPGIRRRRISGTQEQQERACIGSPGSRMAAARPPG